MILNINSKARIIELKYYDSQIRIANVSISKKIDLIRECYKLNLEHLEDKAKNALNVQVYNNK